MSALIDGKVLGRALQNFQASNRREDRAWSRGGFPGGAVPLILSDRERSEFIEQARYQLEGESRRAVLSALTLAGCAQFQSQGQTL